MKCPKCGSDRVFFCTKKIKRPYLRYFECVDCKHQSEKVELFGYSRLIGVEGVAKPKHEIALEYLYGEWDYQEYKEEKEN